MALFDELCRKLDDESGEDKGKVFIGWVVEELNKITSYSPQRTGQALTYLTAQLASNKDLLAKHLTTTEAPQRRGAAPKKEKEE